MDTILKLFVQETWLSYLVVLLVGILFGLLLQWVMFSIIKYYQRKKPSVLKEQLIKHLRTPAKFLLPILFIYSAIDLMRLEVLWQKVPEVLIILNFAWIIIATLQALEEVVKQKFHIAGDHRAKE